MAEAPEFTMSETFASELLIKIEKNTINRENNCILFTGRHTKSGYGVIDVRFPGQKRHSPIHVHRIRYMIHIRCTHLSPSDFHVSHLCHTKNCINISHLNFEPAAVNNSRQNCNSQKRCLQNHSPHPDCLI